MITDLKHRPISIDQRYLYKNQLIKQLRRRSPRFVRHYLDELAFYLDEKTLARLRSFGQFFGIILLTAVLAFIFINNVSAVTVHYDMEKNLDNLSQIVPKNRIQTVILHGEQITKVNDDLVYFTTEMPFHFDTATVKVTFQNFNPNQTFSIGFQDKPSWHYTTQLFDVSFIDSLNWKRTNSHPVLYQREQKYSSLDAFLKQPPQENIIGTYNYNTTIGDVNETTIPSYIPQQNQTIITSPIRGKQIIYAYLDKEPFQMTIEKQDLNWYKNPDPMTIKIVKDNDVIYQTTAPDDGITNGSGTILPPQKVVINSPGPGFPESGVYTIIINANDDTVIKSIQTNLHKIVFQGSLFFAGNSNAYPGIIARTSATTLYTNALSLSALTYHNAGEQTLFVGTKPFTINTIRIPQTITPLSNLTSIFVPYNDIMLNAFQGYFAFSPDQFFLPTKYHILPIKKSQDVGFVDYLLADYLPPYQKNGWQIKELPFDLSTAYVNKNKLSWIIQSPHLKSNNNSIMIKDIQITFHKNGWQS